MQTNSCIAMSARKPIYHFALQFWLQNFYCLLSSNGSNKTVSHVAQQAKNILKKKLQNTYEANLPLFLHALL